MKRAFLCGINYTGSSNPLNGCVNDVKDINNFLVSSCGYEQKNITLITDETQSLVKPTRQNMERGIINFVKGCLSGDILFFYYSGHGSNIRDKNNDETDGRDEVLVPLDYEKSGVITDDWLFTNLVSILPAGVTLWSFADCCHSGTMIDFYYNLQCNSVCSVKEPKTYDTKQWSNNYSVSSERGKITTADVYFFSGCRDSQTSADVTINNRGQGAFTSCFLDLLRKNCTRLQNGSMKFNSGTISLNEMLKEITCNLIIRGFDQRPQLSFGRIQDFSRKFVL